MQEISSFHNLKDNDSRKSLVNSKLTFRQLEIIKLATDSFTNKEIGTKLFIDEKTCKKHRETSYKKLGINGKEEVRLFLRWVKANMEIIASPQYQLIQLLKIIT